MSQPNENAMNYPKTDINGSFKDQEKIPPEAIKQYPNGNNTNFGYPPRPTLNRIDSRGSFPINPGFPNPLQVRQPGQQIRTSPPPPGTVYARPPGVQSRPPFQPPFPPNHNNPNIQFQNQNRPGGPNFRPGTPFPPRGPIPGQYRQPLVQQISEPILENQNLERNNFTRSQTLDSPEGNNWKSGTGNYSYVKNEQSVINMEKNNIQASSDSSNSSSTNLNEEKRNISRSGSVDGGKRSISNSVESLDKKSENEYPSRPESRTGIRRNQVLENEKSNSDYNKPLTEYSNSRPESRNSIIDSKPPSPPITNIIKENNQTPVSTPEPIRKTPKEIKRNNLQLKDLKKGDNDSGVDESTQGNDQSSNGENISPRKSLSKPPKRISSATPSKSRSLSRDSKSPSLKSPDSTATTPGTVEKKKLPMNKIQVGSAPSPNLKEVRSKIGSLQNATHKPGGGNVKIENRKIEMKNVTPRIEAKNEKYTPKSGEKKIITQKLQWNAKSKIGSLENANHKPVSSGKKIETVKLDFKEKAKPKVGSKDNMKHVPGGGDVKIENKKIELNVTSKVGSMDNMKHKPKGGDKKIFDDKEYLRQMSGKSSENHSLSGSQHSLPSQPDAARGADENLNQHH